MALMLNLEPQHLAILLDLVDRYAPDAEVWGVW